jgi:hypothetical protein
VASITGANFGTTRTNLLLRSEEFDNASWTKQSSVSVSANAVTAPNGTLTADTVTADSGLGVFQNITSVIGLNYVNSVYVKAGTATSLLLRDDTGAGRHIQFNPSTGQITATAGTLVGFGSQAVGNDWFRVWMIYAADSTTARGIIRPGSSGSAQTFTVWGAQLETGTTATAYIPTTTAAVSVFESSWYRQDEGTVFAEAKLISASARNGAVFDISDGTSNNRNVYRAITTGNDERNTIRSNSVTVASLSTGTTPDLSARKVASAYKLNDFAYTLNGVSPLSSTSGAVPVSVNQIAIGAASGPSEYLSGTIKRFTYWPTRLPNTTLQQITQ